MSATDRQLYEQAKRSLRQMCEQHGALGPEDGRPQFVLACHECGLPFRADVEMGMVAEHAKLEHGSTATELDLIYVGEGPPPESRVVWPG